MDAEEVLELDDIQGAIVPGFRKDRSLIIGLRIEDVAGCKAWLRIQSKEVATAREVLTFNRLYKAMRVRRGGEAETAHVVWRSISFSAAGLKRLRPTDDQAAFDNKFVDGMFNDTLHDPATVQWKLGSTDETTPHILVVLAADRSQDLDAAFKRLIKEIRATSCRGKPALRLLGEVQPGATLPAPLTGHEHFGFKDGVSQPAIRGRASTDSVDFIDPRQLATTDPKFNHFAEPGRPLVWPGQFVIGYNRQLPNDPLKVRPAVVLTTLPWRKNGSYLVYRRLQQKVHLFWQFSENCAKEFSGALSKSVTPVEFATRLVGRWPSGAPLMRAPNADDATLAQDDSSNNNFQFTNPTPNVTLQDGMVASKKFPTPVADPFGRVCPFIAHIRKVNPRDDPTDPGGPSDTLRRLMLRRGIPYGPPQDPDKLLRDDGVDRGLLFMAYQASITDQFSFLTSTWVNAAGAPHDGEPQSGHDPLIGQQEGERFIRMPIDDSDDHDLKLALPEDPWVVMTGGGYFFTPSISALAGALAE